VGGLGDHHVRGFGSQLAWFLAHDAEVARMMAVDPYRLGRILRPLCHMLGIQVPEPLRLPPRVTPAGPPAGDAVVAPSLRRARVRRAAAEGVAAASPPGSDDAAGGRDAGLIDRRVGLLLQR
jgi:hypothetical protein